MTDSGQPAVTRRRALAFGGAALAAPMLAGIGARQAGGAPLADLPDLPLARQGREVHGKLIAAPSRQRAGGVDLDLLTYGRYPGPVIRLRPDDALTLDFRNGLNEPSNLHTHGLSVPPRGNGDNPYLRVAAGGTHRYRFDLTQGRGNTGLFWYHPHYHGTSAGQLYSGLAGPIVVEEPPPIRDQFGEVDERLIVLKDLQVQDGAPKLHGPRDWVPGLEGPITLVNAQRSPHVEATSRRVRLRLVSAANARYWTLRPEGAEGHALIALDGHILPAAESRETYTIVPGQRLDLLLDLPPTGTTRLTARGAARRGASAHTKETLLTLIPPARGATPRALPPALRQAEPPRAERPVVMTRDVVLSLFYICGSAWGGEDGPPLYSPRAGTREIWRLVNADSMDHPFHLHTWPFRLLSLNGGTLARPPLMDTLNLPPGHRAAIEIDFDGPGGRSLFHCHILEHAQKGMMANLEVS